MTLLPSMKLLSATVVLTGALVVGSGVSFPWYAANDAALRISWSVRPERIEHCRRLSPDEIASRPEHMRRSVECEGRLATYDLTVIIDDSTVDASVVQGAGIRHDRPMFLLRDYHVAPGRHQVQVRLTRREAPDSLADEARVQPDSGRVTTPDDRQSREAVQRRELALDATPAHMALDTAVSFRPNRITLVTFENRRLAVRTP